MSAENEAYLEGTRLVRALTALRNDIQAIDASDTACKERALRLVEESRARLREALQELSGIV
jgi:hypothetical protein